MFSMKRVQLAVLLLTAVALVAGTAAPVFSYNYPARVVQLTPIAPEGDPDDGASGTATLSNIKVTQAPHQQYPWFTAKLTVNCENLTPGATYEVHVNTWPSSIAWQFKASGTGAGGGACRVEWGGWFGPPGVTVVRLDEMADGTILATSVLAGSF